MAMKIIEECGAGYLLRSRVGLYSSMIYDQVVFVDRDKGANGNDGSDWSKPVKDINAAMDKLPGGGVNSVARGRHYAIIFRSRLTSGNKFTAKQTVDVQGVHLIGAGILLGMGGGWDACFVTDYAVLVDDADLSGLAALKAGLQIDADDFLVAGIKFYAPDAAGGMYHIAINDAHGGRNCAIINSVFQGDLNGAVSVHGVGLNGCETALVKDNLFYYEDEAISIGGGGTRYAHGCSIRDNEIDACRYGIRGKNASTVRNKLIRNIITPRDPVAAYGWAITRGIDLTQGQGFLCVEDFVGHATKGTAFAPGTNNIFHRCFYGGTGAAATEYDGT